MLRFQDTPDEQSLATLHAALDDVLARFETWNEDQDFEYFDADYPESAKCFTPSLAEATLKNLLLASKDTSLYQLTDYHWLLLYEVLWNFTTVFNDEPELAAGEALVSQYGIQKINFSEFIDWYFWDTDFLAIPNDVVNIGDKGRQAFGFNSEAYGVIQRWPPHPEELELIKVNSAENTSGK